MLIILQFKQLLPVEDQFQEIIDSVQPIQVFDLESQRADSSSTALPAILELPKHDFDVQLRPALRRLFAKYYSIRDLLTAGLAMQAWSAFASLIRDAEMFGCKNTHDQFSGMS